MKLSLREAIDQMMEKLRAGDLDFATTIGEQVFHQYPENGAVSGLMALASQKAGRLSDAEEYWRSSLDAHGSFVDAAPGDSRRSSISSVRGDLRAIREGLANTLAAARPSDAGMLYQHLWEIDRMLGSNRAYFSQAGQDKFMDGKVFHGQSNGVFVEIGGHDGVVGSNTLFFEKFRSWTGLCIEPVPTHYRRMLEFRASECLNVAISDFEGEAEFLEITKGMHQMGGLTEELRPDLSEVLSETAGTESHVINVPVTRFDTIAKDRSLRHVDYCSIDVEGAEMKVLQGIDFDYTHIAAMSIENPPHLVESFSAIRRFMHDHGYRLIATIGSDDIFVRS